MNAPRSHRERSLNRTIRRGTARSGSRLDLQEARVATALGSKALTAALLMLGLHAAEGSSELVAPALASVRKVGKEHAHA